LLPAGEKGGRERHFLPVYDEYHDRILSYITRGVRHLETAGNLIANVFFKARRYFRKKLPSQRQSLAVRNRKNEILMRHRFHRMEVCINREAGELQLRRSDATSARS
jgi:hypothetical protein